jgi:glycosyltransferase involved in cell wall biosynthesis
VIGDYPISLPKRPNDTSLLEGHPRPVQLSVVIPVFNSEDLIGRVVERTIGYLTTLGYSFEIVLVNDGSTDHSWRTVKQLAEDDTRIVGINFLKNYGQHTAVWCGIRQAKGEWIVTMDDDLQNPPEEIGKLIAEAENGHDLVFGKFLQKRHSLSRRLGSKLIGYLNKKIFHKPDHITLSNFRIFSKAVGARVARYHSAYPYIPGLLLMFSANPGNVVTEHHERTAGRSNYTPFRILQLAARLLFGYSSYPLKVLAGLGFVISGVSFALGLFYIVSSLVRGSLVPGWTTIVVLLSFLNGFIIVMLGVLGEYVSRIMNQISVDDAYYIHELITHDR